MAPWSTVGFTMDVPLVVDRPTTSVAGRPATNRPAARYIAFPRDGVIDKSSAMTTNNRESGGGAELLTCRDGGAAAGGAAPGWAAETSSYEMSRTGWACPSSLTSKSSAFRPGTGLPFPSRVAAAAVTG